MRSTLKAGRSFWPSPDLADANRTCLDEFEKKQRWLSHSLLLIRINLRMLNLGAEYVDPQEADSSGVPDIHTMNFAWRASKIRELADGGNSFGE